MASLNKPTSKPSKVAKMGVKPIWRKKLNPCNTSNGFNVNLPTLMPKPLTPHHQPSQENNHPNQVLPNPYIKNTTTSSQGTSKEVGKRCTKKYNYHPPVSLDEPLFQYKRKISENHVASRLYLKTHMPDFHHYDDARDIWMAVKARFGGNEESKKMKKTMLKQQFAEFSVTEEEGLHKGYDRFQKILSQLNQVQARPDNDDINLKFLRALPSSWSQVALALKTRGGLESMSFDDLYNKLRSLELDPTYSDQQRIVPSVSQTPGRSDNVMECVLQSYDAEMNKNSRNDYEDFDQFDDKARTLLFKAQKLRTDERKAFSHVDFMVELAQKERKNGKLELEATLANLKNGRIFQELKNLIDSSMSTRTKVAGDMHAIAPPITGTYMPSPNQSDIEKHSMTSHQTLRPPCSCEFKPQRRPRPRTSTWAVDIQTCQSLMLKTPNSTTGSPVFLVRKNIPSSPVRTDHSPILLIEPHLAGCLKDQQLFLLVDQFLLGTAVQTIYRLLLGEYPTTILGSKSNGWNLVNPHGFTIMIPKAGSSHNMAWVSQVYVMALVVRFIVRSRSILKLEVEIIQMPDAKSGGNSKNSRKHISTHSTSQLATRTKGTCYRTKASLEESTKWHRRMAHVNFKNNHKLVQGGPSSSNVPRIMERNADKKKKKRGKKSCAKLKDREKKQMTPLHNKGYFVLLQATAKYYDKKLNEIRDQGVSAAKDPAGTLLADSDPALFNLFTVSAEFNPVYADESTLPPGQQLGSSENTTRFPVPSYDDDFRATLTNLAPASGVNSIPTNGSRAQNQVWLKLRSLEYIKINKAKALEDPDWVDAMQEEMQQFINQQVWKLVPLPGHRQEEGIDYDEVFAPVARIEAIRLFLAFASYMGFLVYQLDVKSAFLYGEIEEEVYVTQPKGFEDPYFPKHVYRVVKALYGLHQAPRAWYARLSTFLLQHNYRRGTIDKTLFIKKDSRDIILVQVYVDDIIFGSTNKAWCDEFEVLMKGEFEMSAMGEMTFFLGLQVKQLPDGLFISQDKYVKDMLTKFDMESVRTATTPYEAAKTKLKDETDPPVNVHLYRSMIGSLMYLTASRPDIMFAVSACSRHQVTPLTSHLNAVKKIFKYLKGQPKLGLWYPKDSPFQLEAYSDSDYAGSHGDRKSTTGGCQFLGRRLISWQCKKQTIVATSSTEAEYVAAASCCAQVLWIQNQLLDYGFNFMNTKIFIDNQSTICIVKNPVFHQRTKHIEIRHHFIRDANEKNLIQVLKIHTDDNVADLLTKAFDGPRFAYLVVHIGMVDMMLVSAGCTMVLLVVILPAGRMVSAGWSMVLLVVIFPAARLVSAGCTMVLLVVIFPAGRLVSAGCTMVLLVVIFSADWFLLVVLWFCWKLLFLLDSLFLLVAMGYAAGRFISADRVFVPAVYMVSAVG
ncbi:putative ribonuclease H-like domain-containing protein [Tanacetum coccineum]|uniref:Ribonuclease H-like domain-containing protein n=1 Tax=Tanacetum coccineum TaxID=301880 RepID=A0ABQ5AA59_9ASTR